MDITTEPRDTNPDDEPVDTSNREHQARTFAVGFTVEVDRFETYVYLGGHLVLYDNDDPDTFDSEIGAMRTLTYAERRDRALKKVANGLYHLMEMPDVVEANKYV